MRVDTFEDWFESLTDGEKQRYSEDFNGDYHAAYAMELQSMNEFYAEEDKYDRLERQ